MANKSVGRRLSQRRNWGEEDRSPNPLGVDAEMFGRMIRYKSIVSENMVCNYFKDLEYSNILWESMASTITNTANGSNPLPSINDYILFLKDGLTALEYNAETGLAVVESRVVTTDIDITSSSLEDNRLNTVYNNNLTALSNILSNTEELSDDNKQSLEELKEINQKYYDLIYTIRKTIIDNLIVID